MRGGSFNDLVGGHLHDQRHCQAKRLGGFVIDNQIELRRLFDGKSSRFCALGLLRGAEMSEVEPPPLALPVECYQIRTGTPAASDVTDRGVGVVRDGVLRATKGDVDPGCVAAGPGVPLQRHVCLRAIWSTEVSSAPNPRNPITGIAGCCARAARGHAAAPPSVAKNFRRSM